MRISMYRTDLPEWTKKAMKMTCDYCGAFILDNSDTGVTTARWCANPKCPGHMSYKLSELAKRFGIKGVGPKTAEHIIASRQLKTHLDMLNVWYPETKPVVRLSEVATLAYLGGYGDTTAEKELDHFANFSDYFSRCMNINPILWANKNYLLECEKYFELLPPLSARQLNVMATGSFHGYSNRKEFFNLINTAFGQYVHVIEKGNSYIGISYLIMELDAPVRSKANTAADHNIPVVTPTEFVAILHSAYPYVSEGI